MSATNTDEQQPTFPQFNLLSDDLQIIILSYVADAPFESMNTGMVGSSLTHVLPLISKHVSGLLEGTTLLWKHALVRNVKLNPSLWEDGMLRLLKDCLHRHNVAQSGSTTNQNQIQDDKASSAYASQMGHSRGNSSSQSGNSSLGRPQDDSRSSIGEHPLKNVFSTSRGEDDYEKKLVNQVCQVVSTAYAGGNPPSDELISLCPNASAAQLAYHYITIKHLRFTGPVFHMPGEIRIGQEFSLHFFERRYCILIAMVMDGFPPEARRGGPVGVHPQTQAAPRFIYAYNNSMSDAAVIVEVRHCHIHPNGRADVVLVPVAHVHIRNTWQRPNTGRMSMANAMKMGDSDSRATDRKLELRGYHGFRRGQYDDELEEDDGSAFVDSGVRSSIASVIAYLMTTENAHNMIDGSSATDGVESAD